MKKFQCLAASLLAMVAAGSAFAQTPIRITGSTAFRAATVASIINSLNSPTAAFVGAGPLQKAAQSVIVGTLKSGPSAGQSVAFELAWAGSVGGVQMVTQNLKNPPLAGFTDATTWLAPTNPLSAAAVTITNSGKTYAFSGGTGVSSGSAVYDANQVADVTMSDTFQANTGWTSPSLSNVNDGNGGVGVVPFVWVKGPAGAVPSANWGHLTNMNANGARSLLTNGVALLSTLTGNSADAGFSVVLTGRNNDSGTRTDTFDEEGFGGTNPLGVSATQFQLNVVSGQITSFTPFSGSGGYNSGGQVTGPLSAPVAASLTDPVYGNPCFVVSYLGIADAFNINAGQNVLTYNGAGVNNISFGGALDIFASNFATSIEQGGYSLWAYEHVLYRSSLSGVPLNATTLFANQILTQDAIATGDLIGNMHAARNDELNPIVGF